MSVVGSSVVFVREIGSVAVVDRPTGGRVGGVLTFVPDEESVQTIALRERARAADARWAARRREAGSASRLADAQAEVDAASRWLREASAALEQARAEAVVAQAQAAAWGELGLIGVEGAPEDSTGRVGTVCEDTTGRGGTVCEDSTGRVGDEDGVAEAGPGMAEVRARVGGPVPVGVGQAEDPWFGLMLEELDPVSGPPPEWVRVEPRLWAACLESAVPGVALAEVLERLDLDLLADEQVPRAVAAYERLASWAAHGAARAAAVLVRRVGELGGAGTDRCVAGQPGSPASHEVAVALGWSRAQAARLVRSGLAFEEALGDTGDLLARGQITPQHAQVLVDRLGEQPVELALAVQAEVLPDAGACTPATLAQRIDRALLVIAPQEVAAQAVAARDRRRVGRPRPVGAGMASISAMLPSVDAARLDATLEQLARSAHAAGDPRTLQQLRADVLVALGTGDAYRGVADPAHRGPDVTDRPVPGPSPGAASRGEVPAGVLDVASCGEVPLVPVDAESSGRATAPPREWAPPGGGPGEDHGLDPGFRLPPPGSVLVNVTISAQSLLGLNDLPGWIAGVGPVDAVTARALAYGGALWRRIVTDPLTNAVLDVGRTRYRPNAAQIAHVQASRPTCVCGTCNLPATLCDCDHTQDWRYGGRSDDANFTPLCRGTHQLKTSGWLTLTRLDDQHYQWTTRLGQAYQTTVAPDTPTGATLHRPPPDDDPPPF